jgi:hypothetical protein
MPNFLSVDDVRRTFDDQGSYWFSPDTMASFGTSMPDRKVYGNRFFITRESSRRGFTDKLYAVREICVHSNGEYWIRNPHSEGFRNLNGAREFIREQLQEETV